MRGTPRTLINPPTPVSQIDVASTRERRARINDAIRHANGLYPDAGDEMIRARNIAFQADTVGTVR